VRSLAALAWRSLAARRVRTALTIAGVALGVGVLFAMQLTNATLDAAVDLTVRDLVGRADLRVRAFAESGLSPASVEAIRTTPGVGAAAPVLERRTFLVASESPAGDPVTVEGVDPEAERLIRDLALVRGVDLAPDTQRSILVTEALARERGLDLGSAVTLYGAGAPIEYRVIGVVAGDGPVPTPFGRTAWITLDSARDLFATDAVSAVDVDVALGADEAAVADALTVALTTEPYLLETPADIAAGLRESTLDIRAVFAIVAAVILFVAAFLIFNTMSMSVAERLREVALLRAAGATRRQVGWIFVLQAIVVGLAGAAIGGLLGVALGAVVLALLRASEGIRVTAVSIDPAGPAFALALGVLVTVVAALEPAWRAGRLSPVEALRAGVDPSVSVRARLWWLAAVALVVGAGGALLLPEGAASGIGLLGPLLVYLVLLSIALASPFLLRPLGALAAIPFSLVFRTEARLTRRALVRDPARTALTVGALAIGIAMVVAVASAGSLSRATASAWIADVVPGSTVVTSIRPIAPDEGVQEALAAVPGVERVTPIGSFVIPVQAEPGSDPYRVPASAISGADLLADGRLTFVGGDRTTALGGLDAGGSAILPKTLADRLGLGVGGTMRIGFGDAVTDLAVTGVVEHTFPGPGSETALVSWADATGRFGVAGAGVYAVRYAAGRESEASPAVAALARELALEPTTLQEVRDQAEGAVGRLFGLFDAIAVIAIVVAGLGIVNTLAMNVMERVREIGVLRATGLLRSQAWRMVLVEAGILGVVGSVLGIVAGLVVAVVMLATQGAKLASIADVPWATIVVVGLLGVAVAMLAAAYPAHLASRVSIIRAVRGE
jgi:putative ABC transport system permease protein